MAGRINARQKGKSGEYEVMQMLQDIADDIFAEFRVEAPRLRRNAMACADGGEDLVGLPWYSFEVKRVETLAVGQWWAQCVEQARRKRQDWSDAATWKLMPDYFESRREVWQDPEVMVRSRVLQILAALAPVSPTFAAEVRGRYFDNANNPGIVKGAVAIGSGPGALARVPVLLYRQNRRAWNVVTTGHLTGFAIGNQQPTRIRTPVDVAIEPWLQWFRVDLRSRLLAIYWNPPATKT